MSQFILILFWFAIMAVFARFVDVEEDIILYGKRRKTVKLWYAVLVFVPIIIMATFRGNFADTGSYLGEYGHFPETFSGLPEAVKNIQKDHAFYILEMLIKIVISKDYRVCFFIIAVIQSTCLIRLYRKYSSSYYMAMLLFVLSTDYISWMFNGIRQFTAVCICLLATESMIDRKYITAIVVIIIASLFHQSALLMIPIMFIAQGPPGNRRTIIMVFCAVLALLYVSQFTKLLDSALAGTQYTDVVSDWTEWQDDGTNPLRVLVYSVPAILGIIGLKYIKQEKSKVVDFTFNMSIVAMALYLISMGTSGIFLGRLPIYASLYSQGILLPWEIDNIFNERSAVVIKIAMIICYLGFYYYQMHMVWRFM